VVLPNWLVPDQPPESGDVTYNNTEIGPEYLPYSIFRDIVNTHTGDTTYNRMLKVKWEFRILDIESHASDGDSGHAWLALISSGWKKKWYEGSRVLLATLTFMVYPSEGCGTMEIGIDSTSWPPGNYPLQFIRYDAIAYFPRHFLPIKDTLYVLPLAILSLCPEEGANADRVYVTITGSNCQTGASVKLARAGVPADTVSATEVFVKPYTRIIAGFDLADQPIGSIWDLIVTNPNGAADTLFSAFKIVSPSELSPKDVLCVLSSNHELIQDFQADAKAWSKFNGAPLDSIIHSLSLYKSPDKVKNIDYANDDTTQIISTVINRGWLQYEVDPQTSNAYETNLLEVANMTPSEFAGLNFYDPDNFLFHHYVNIKEIHEYPDSLTFVLEAIPKRAEWTYTKLE
jgi:hypothetical protein